MRALLLLICTALRFCSVPTLTPTPAIIPTPTIIEHKTISFQNEHYAYSYFIVQNHANITLTPNYSQKIDTQSLMHANGCKHAINGGFYDTNNKPLGYFQSDETIVSPRIESDLVNGFLWADASGSAVISSTLPHLSFQFALQTGPMLLFDGRILPLSIHNDTHARRMVAAKNSELVFLTIYNPDSVYEGPLLSDLPSFVEQISTQEHLDIEDAINLDGGSASVFYSEDTKLSELTFVGSIFCVL